MDSGRRCPVAKKSGRLQQEQRSKELMRNFLIGYRDWMEVALRREKLTLPQLRMLHAVQEGEGASAASIARACQIAPQTLQAMLERAVRERWIVRRHSEENQRILVASLTSKGEAILARGKALSDELSAKVWSGVPEDALRRCNDVLEAGVAALHIAAEEQTIPRPRAKKTRNA